MPVLVVCEGCRAEYHLKDEYGGKKVRCKDCGTVIIVPADTASSAWQPGEGWESGPFDRDRFLIHQKRVSISEKYYVFDDRQNPILFVERPAHAVRTVLALLACISVAVVGAGLSLLPALSFDKPEARGIGMALFLVGLAFSIAAAIATAIWLSPRRHVSFYTDDSKSELLLEVLQDHKFNVIIASYTIRDPEDGTLARLRKNHLSNIVRKRWDVLRPDGSLLVVAREDSLLLSLLRRLLGPMLGLLRTNFVILRPQTEIVVGEFNRKATLFDRYVLDMSADRAYELDRRVAVALGVMLDTGEGR